MTVEELIHLLEGCNRNATIEVAFELHSCNRVLMPTYITVVDDGDTDEDGEYHWTCTIDLGKF